MTRKQGTEFNFKLYITGKTQRSEQAILNLRKICEEILTNQCQIAVIDILESPELAETQKIIATPTLVKETPLPMRRIIGDLSDLEKVLFGLGLSPHIGKFVRK
jgi:circadian clock protein KaiB